MEKAGIKRQLQAYGRWKDELARTVRTYQAWLKKHGMATPEANLRVAHCLEGLEKDRLRITVVADFSRGKTELINALFFADYGSRLLPSSAGRTTLCPTEIFYDNAVDAAYVRLLPIETRLQERSLSDLKKEAKQWVHYPLNLSSSKQIEEALSQVTETRRVSVEEAGRLGLYDQELHPDHAAPPTHIEIPRWRHALISFPHPLLRQGLSIMDTPGLSVLGYEPELIPGMLQKSEAVLFVLAADAGVTHTDLEMWQHHIKGFRSSRQRGLAVVLNKIDALPQGKTDGEGAIKKQRASTAKVLGIDEKAIFPVSARDGLIAKMSDDKPGFEGSALPELETYLSKSILAAKQDALRKAVVADACRMIKGSRDQVASNLAAMEKEQEELKALNGESREVILYLMRKSQEAESRYLSDINLFRADRSRLNAQTKMVQEKLDIDALDRLVMKNCTMMLNAWTTRGAKNGLNELLAEMSNNMRLAAEQAEQTSDLVSAIYSRFQEQHGLTALQPKSLSFMHCDAELARLCREADAFRWGSTALMGARRSAVESFFKSAVDRARKIFIQARQETDSWLEEALQPLMYQIRDHKDMMERQLQDLRKVSRSRDTLEARILELGKMHKVATRRLIALRNMHNTLVNSHPLTEESRPRLVSKKMAS